MKEIFKITKKKGMMMLLLTVAFIASTFIGVLIVEIVLRILAEPIALSLGLTSFVFLSFLYFFSYLLFAARKPTPSRFSKNLAPALAALITWLLFEKLFDVFRFPLVHFTGAQGWVLSLVVPLIAFIIAIYVSVSIGIEIVYPSQMDRDSNTRS